MNKEYYGSENAHYVDISGAYPNCPDCKTIFWKDEDRKEDADEIAQWCYYCSKCNKVWQYVP